MTRLILAQETFPIADTGRVVLFSKDTYTNLDVLVAQDLEENKETAYNVESIFAQEEGLKKGYTLYILVEKNNIHTN